MKHCLRLLVHQTKLCHLLPALLGASILLPTQAVGQAINTCNLLPNPSFEQQNVARPSGYPNNILGANSDYDEVTGWQSIGSYRGASSYYGQPTYYATNAPAGSATNPFTNPATNPNGSPFQPYNYDPSLHNGALSIIAAEYGTSSPINQPQYVTPSSTLSLSAGATYYASFQAYRSSAPGSPVRLGMNLSQGSRQTAATSTSMQSGGTVTSYSWTRVSGKISIPSSSSSDPWYVTIGNISPNGPGARTRYYIDEVELYKIPTAGSFNACAGSSNVLIGEGCPIPQATYAWTVSGSSTPFSTSLQTTVNPTNTTTYVLTVQLPDNNTSVSQVTVTVGPPPPESISFSGQVSLNQIYYMDNPRTVYDGSYMCQGSTLSLDVSTAASSNGTAPTWTVYQMNPGEYSLSISNNGLHAEFVPYVPGYGQPQHPATFEVTFRDKCGAPYSRRFTIVSQQGSDPRYPCNDNSGGATGGGGGGGGGGTTGPIGNEPYVDGLQAYPNPASETLSMPQDTKSGVLLNSQGRPVKETKNGSAIDVRNLPAGLYNLRTIKQGKVSNQHIEVKH